MKNKNKLQFGETAIKLTGKLIPPKELTTLDRDRMFLLMRSYFDRMKRETFEYDLDDKEWVIILRDCHSQTIQGFSTLQLLDATVMGQPIRAIFSGDTIVDREYWGENELPRVWGAYILKLISDNPTVPLYWFLISKGFRTYKYLPALFFEFYPSYDKPTPPFEEEVIFTLADKKYPALYNRATGVIRPLVSSPLNETMATVEENKLGDPHVSYFLKKNPGYRDGEELACLTLLSIDNLRPLARRIFARYANQD